MRYIRADVILPSELLEAVQQYVDGQLIYIPRKEKQEWGNVTASRKYYNCWLSYGKKNDIARKMYASFGFVEHPEQCSEDEDDEMPVTALAGM